ncbi:MAG TPA: flagellar assembly protein FliH [Rhodocyclaceae bacterium]|nr:flagellar assembly protein FliH [Rhodocyclaceae bacterium]
MTKSNLTAWERWELASFDEAQELKHHPLHPPKVEAPPPPVPEPEVLIQLPTAEEVEEIRRQAHEAGFQEGRDAGYQDGYANGHKEGYEAGHQEGYAPAAEAAQKIAALAAKLDNALAELDPQIADELAALALEMAQEVLRQTIRTQPETIVNVIHDALTHLPHQHANIYLNPADAALVRQYAGDQLNHAGHRIHEDQRLNHGDVLLEAGGAQVDASVANRWRRVVATLGMDMAWNPESPPAPEPAVEEAPSPEEDAP